MVRVKSYGLAGTGLSGDLESKRVPAPLEAGTLPSLTPTWRVYKRCEFL